MSVSDSDVSVLISAVVAAVGVLLPLWKFYSNHKALIDMGTKALAFAVTEVSKKTSNTVDDKFALFFQHLSGSLEAKGKVLSEAQARKVFEKLQGVK